MRRNPGGTNTGFAETTSLLATNTTHCLQWTLCPWHAPCMHEPPEIGSFLQACVVPKRWCESQLNTFPLLQKNTQFICGTFVPMQVQ